MTGSQAAELDAPIPARKAGRGGEQQPSTGLTQETEWQPDWKQNWVCATTAPLLVRPTLRHAGVVLVVVMTGGTRLFEAFSPFFDEDVDEDEESEDFVEEGGKGLKRPRSPSHDDDQDDACVA